MRLRKIRFILLPIHLILLSCTTTDDGASEAPAASGETYVLESTLKSFDFGSINLGQDSAAIDFLLQNTGNGLSITHKFYSHFQIIESF